MPYVRGFRIRSVANLTQFRIGMTCKCTQAEGEDDEAFDGCLKTCA